MMLESASSTIFEIESTPSAEATRKRNCGCQKRKGIRAGIAVCRTQVYKGRGVRGHKSTAAYLRGPPVDGCELSC